MRRTLLATATVLVAAFAVYLIVALRSPPHELATPPRASPAAPAPARPSSVAALRETAPWQATPETTPALPPGYVPAWTLHPPAPDPGPPPPTPVPPEP